MITRETIYAALFAKLIAAYGWGEFSRRLKHWGDPFASPAMFMAQRHETPSQQRGLPSKWTLLADVYIYINMGESDTELPAIQLNPALDAIEAAVAPDSSSGFQTLGGLVSHAWINGTIETDEGTLGSKAVAIVPIEILAV